MRKIRLPFLAAFLLLAGLHTSQGQLELILSDGFEADTSNDINQQVATRQTGSAPPVLLTERPEHAAGGPADEFTLVDGGKLILLVDGTTWVSPDYNFIDGPTFTVEVDVNTSDANPDRTSEDWAAVVFGSTRPGASVNTSDGMGILFRNNGGYQVFNGSEAIFTSGEDDVLPAGELTLRVEVTGTSFSGSDPATVAFFLGGQPLKIAADGTNTFTRPAGFRGNYVSLVGYAGAGNFWQYSFDDLRVSADACVHFRSPGVVLRSGETGPSVSVKVPQDFAPAGGSAVVRVRSSSPDVATPVGAVNGELELTFSGTRPEGLLKTFELEIKGKGGAILELTTDRAACIGGSYSVAVLSGNVRNPSFEANTHTAFPGYGEVLEWSGMSGINAIGVNGGGPFHDNGVYPDRNQIGFKQGNGIVSQEISGLTPNKPHWLQFRYNIRNCCGTFTQGMIVRFDGTELDTIADIRAVGGNNPYNDRTFVFVPTTEMGLLEIEGTGEGDHTLLLDGVTIVQRDDGNVNVHNPSFEASGVVTGTGIISPQNISGWTGDGTVGANLGGAGPFADNGIVPDQDNAAFIQGVGSLSQTLRGLIPGETYTVTFAVNARSGDSPHLRVTAGEAVVLEEDVAPVGGTAPYTARTGTFVAASGSVALKFEQTREGDDTLLLDDIRVLGESVNLPPIDASPRSVELSVGVTGQTLSITVPAILIAEAPATVTVTSQNPAVAIPVGASGGALAVTFAAGGETTQTVEIQAVGRGETTFRLSNADNVPFTLDTIAIIVSGSFVRNPSFESNFHPTFPGYGPIDAWISEGPGNTGVNNSSGPFHDNGVIPDRAQIALLQGTKTIRQQIVNLTPGQPHWLQFHYNARNCCGGVISLAPRFDDVDLALIDAVQPVGETNPYVAATYVFTPAASSGTLEFVATAEQDATVLLDGVSIVRRDAEQVMVMNPSFEASGRVAFPGYVQPQQLAGWTGTGGNWGVNAGGVGPFADNGTHPDQDNVAFLQGQGAGIRQVIGGLIPGSSYVISVAANARNGNSPGLKISVDGVAVFEGAIAPVGGTAPYTRVEGTFAPTSDTAEIAFEQTAAGDNTVVLDDVTVKPGTGPVRPMIQVGRAEAGIRISWPAIAADHILQTSATVLGGWTDSTLPVNTDGAARVVIDSISDAAKYYRLIQR